MRRGLRYFLMLCLVAAVGRALAQTVAGDHFSSPRDLGSAASAGFTESMNPFTVEAGEPGGFAATLWCLWQAPADGICEVRARRVVPLTSSYSWGGLKFIPHVYQGSGDFSQITLVPLVSNGIIQNVKQFRVTAGQYYRIQLGMTPFYWSLIVPMGTATTTTVIGGGIWPVITIGSIGGNDECAFTLEMLPPSPPHDDFANAHDLGGGADATFTGTNRAATSETGEPELGTYGARDTVWHRQAVPSAGGYEAIVESTEFLQLSVYSGSTLGGLTFRAGGSPHYNNPALGRVRLRFEAAAGETIHFRLRGNGYGRQGAYTLRVRRLSPPANDLRANALDLGSALPATGSGTTADAGTEAGVDPSYSYAGADGTASVWWRWTAASTGWVRLTLPSGQVSMVGVFENGTRLGYSDSQPAPAVFRAVTGRTYHIRLATSWEDEGPVSFTLDACAGFEHALPELALDLGSAATLSAPLVLITRDSVILILLCYDLEARVARR